MSSKGFVSDVNEHASPIKTFGPAESNEGPLKIIFRKDVFTHRAMVAELVWVSHLIDTLSMLKVKGSNPGFIDYFLNFQSLDKNDSTQSEIFDHVQSHNLDFG